MFAGILMILLHGIWSGSLRTDLYNGILLLFYFADRAEYLECRAEYTSLDRSCHWDRL